MSSTKKINKIICIDIDNVVCKTRKKDYRNARPNKTSIQKINEMYDRGFVIKFFTGRYMGRSKESIKLAKRRGYQMTTNQLKKWKIKYHKLIFGKPSFDLLIDDKALFFKKNWYKKIDRYLR